MFLRTAALRRIAPRPTPALPRLHLPTTKTAAAAAAALRFSSSTATPSPAATGGTDSSSPQLPKPTGLDEHESELWDLLTSTLSPTELVVKDVSGGCGSMYAIDITSPQFRGLGMLKQQRLVNSVLGERVKGWHGVQLRTKAA